jgi:hypothetical protein
MPFIDLSTVRYLVYSGGSVLGWVFCGMDETLDAEFARANLDIRTQLKGVAANSVGSFFALARVCGYSALEFRQLIIEQSDILRPQLLINLTRLPFEKGCVSPKPLIEFVKQLLRIKFGSEHMEMTFRELYERTRVSMTFITYNVSKTRKEYVNYKTYPNLPVWKGVLMTSSMPLVFPPVEYQGQLYVDGGMVDNVPLDAVPMHEALAMCIRTYHTDDTSSGTTMSISEYLCRLTHPVVGNVHNMRLDSFDIALKERIVTINLPCTAMTTDEFAVPKEDREGLIEKGRIVMQRRLYYGYHYIGDVLYTLMRT